MGASMTGSGEDWDWEALGPVNGWRIERHASFGGGQGHNQSFTSIPFCL
jgi:hypothetical protein